MKAPTLIGIQEFDRTCSITWAVSNQCNYKCSYCREELWGRQASNLDQGENYKKSLRQLFSAHSQRGCQALVLFFTGGEPSIWRPLPDFLRFLHEESPRFFSSLSIGINTNLSRPLAWWEEHYSFFHRIIASFHVESAAKDRFLQNLLFLEDKCSTTVRLMMHPDRFDEVTEFGESLKKETNLVSIEYAPLFNSLSTAGAPIRYSEQQASFLLANPTAMPKGKKKMARKIGPTPALIGRYSDNSFREIFTGDVISSGQNHFRGWRCHVGEAIFIDHDGQILTATCGQGPILGNIHAGQGDLDVDRINDHVICDRELCHCGSDIRIRKYRPPGP